MQTRTIIAISVVAGIAALGGTMWFVMHEKGSELVAKNAAGEEIPTSLVYEGVAGEGTREYKNEKFHISLRVPQELTVKEYRESGDSLSVTFQSAVGKNEFQVFVTPYPENQITRERFLLDIPSGVMEEPVDVMIGGVRATAFWSENSVMGETREVWFIKDGLLYEVVTYKELDTWLAEIMRTWRFI